MSESNDDFHGRDSTTGIAGRFKLFGRNADSLNAEPFLSSGPLRILVAPLLDDTKSVQTSRVYDALRTHLNAGKLRGQCDYRRLNSPIHPQRFATGGDEGQKIASQILSRLTTYGANVMIWGHAVRDDQTLRLSITTRQDVEANSSDSFVLDGPILNLPQNFTSDLGAAIAALVVSKGHTVTDQVSDYIVPQARIIAAALEPWIDSPLPDSSLEQRGNLREAAACAHAFIGIKAGENAPLETAIRAYRKAANDYVVAGLRGRCATAQNNLGNALGILSEREAGTEHLAEAVTAFREALKEHTHERMPAAWAMTQNSLGSALGLLGERETGTEHLAEAASAFREALKEYTQQRSPLDWAAIQNNLGCTLRAQGARESGTERLVEAVAAFREALKEYTRDRAPIAWATTQINLGSTLGILGECETGTEHHVEAVAAFNEALREYTRSRMPLAWAMTQHNLGAALRTLGIRMTSNERLIDSATAFREALKERTRDRVPLAWATTQNSLGATLGILGERETGTARLDEAINACLEALKVCTRAHSPYEWAHIQVNLSNLYRSLFRKTSDPAHMAAARTHTAAALEVIHENNAADTVETAQELTKGIEAAAPPD